MSVRITPTPTKAEEVARVTELTAVNSTDSSKKTTKSWALASLVLIIQVGCAVLEAQLTSIGFALPENETAIADSKLQPKRFEAPHFYSFCRFLGRSTAFPIIFLGFWAYSTCTSRKFSPKEFYRHCVSVAGPGPDGITFMGAFKLFTLPALFSLFTGVGYIVSLVYIPASISSACFCATVAISYLLSIFFLKHPHLVIKTFFVLCSFGGVAMIAYETTTSPIRSDAYIGIIAVLGGAAALALHQLFYTLSFPKGDSFQSAFIVSVIFAICACVYFPVALVTKLVGFEIWQWSQVPWGYLIGAVSSSLAVAFLYAYGLAISSPFFMSLGELLNLTLSGIIDQFAREVPIGPLQISGFVIIGLSFLILLLPDDMLTIASIRNRLVGPGGSRATVNITGKPVHASESKKNLMMSDQSLATASN